MSADTCINHWIHRKAVWGTQTAAGVSGFGPKSAPVTAISGR
jgi:hypothetical protein